MVQLRARRSAWPRRHAAIVLACTASVLAALFASPPAVEAKTTFETAYTLAQTYNAALRLVRVDLGLAITEWDPSVAYILSTTRAPKAVSVWCSGRSRCSTRGAA